MEAIDTIVVDGLAASIACRCPGRSTHGSSGQGIAASCPVMVSTTNTLDEDSYSPPWCRGTQGTSASTG